MLSIPYYNFSKTVPVEVKSTSFLKRLYDGVIRWVYRKIYTAMSTLPASTLTA